MQLHLVTVNHPRIECPDVGLYGETADPKKVLADLRQATGADLYYRKNIPELKKRVPVFSYGISGTWTTKSGLDGEYEVQVYAIEVRDLPLFRVKGFAYIPDRITVFEKEELLTAIDPAKAVFEKWTKELSTLLSGYSSTAEGFVRIEQLGQTPEHCLVAVKTVEEWRSKEQRA
jgi:hypothetical protein